MKKAAANALMTVILIVSFIGVSIGVGFIAGLETGDKMTDIQTMVIKRDEMRFIRLEERAKENEVHEEAFQKEILLISFSTPS